MKPAYQLARGKREEGGREKGSRSAWNLTISGWFALFLCNYRDRARPLFSLSSLFGSTFFGLSSLSTKLLPQINFATSASLQTPRSALSCRALDSRENPFYTHSAYRSIRESQRHVYWFHHFYLYIYFFSRNDSFRFPFIPSLIRFSLACSGAYFRFPRVGGLTVAPCNTISRGNS